MSVQAGLLLRIFICYYFLSLFPFDLLSLESDDFGGFEMESRICVSASMFLYFI